MDKLTPELHRILLKRMTKALTTARYEPAKCVNPADVAAEVLAPYAPKIGVCLVCGGSGSCKIPSAVDSRKTIDRFCMACKGTGTIHE